MAAGNGPCLIEVVDQASGRGLTAGVHEDGIDRGGIETYLRPGEELAEAVVRSLADRAQPPLQSSQA